MIANCSKHPSSVANENSQIEVRWRIIQLVIFFLCWFKLENKKHKVELLEKLKMKKKNHKNWKTELYKF